MRGPDADFTRFVEQASPSLLRTAWLLTGDGEAARELVQATLVKVYVRWRKVEPATATAYARRVLVNHAKDTWRHQRREPAIEDPPANHPGRAVVPDSSEVLPERDTLFQALRRLPAQQRAVVVLRYYCDRPVEEVAGLLGISEGAVKSAASRGLACLRGHYRLISEERR